jgi:hypothetical protein
MIEFLLITLVIFNLVTINSDIDASEWIRFK